MNTQHNIRPNNAINTDVQKRRFALLSHAGYKEFERAGILNLFSAVSFSSDHGMVKPSPRPFELVLGRLGITRSEAIVVGDSPRRDLGGAKSAGIDCILVGGAEHPDALKSFGNLLELCNVI